MIHHVFIIDARHDIVVQKKFWVIDVNTIEVEDFATRIKESKSLFIEQIGETKYIGQIPPCHQLPRRVRRLHAKS